MDERQRAVVLTHMVTAMKKLEPARLDPVISELSLTPWDSDVAALLSAVRSEIERQKFQSAKSKSKAR